MKRWMVAAVLSVSLALGGGVQIAGAQAVQEKVKAATDKAAKDYYAHGLILAGEGRDEQAAASFRKALAIKPDWAEAHSLLGSTLSRAGSLKEAEDELRKAVTLKPDYAEGWNYLGQFLKERGKEQEAQEAFRKAQQFAR
jgi:protein O-GlcNAc transferase